MKNNFLKDKTMRVFTLTQLYGKEIPSAEQFAEALLKLRQGFQKFYDDQEKVRDLKSIRLLGAVVIGSIARQHDISCTSDIDIVTFYDDRTNGRMLSYEEMERYAKKARWYYVNALVWASKCNIPVNVYNTFWSLLAKGETRHNKQFLKHAIKALDGFDKGPSGLLVGEKDEIKRMFLEAPTFTREEAMTYLLRKQEKIRDGYFSWDGLSEERRSELFGHAFNAPFHGARQVMDVKRAPYVDTKEGVIEGIFEFSPDASRLLQSLADIAIDYIHGCVAFRDDAKNKALAPRLSFETVYTKSYPALSSLHAVLK